MPVYPMDRLLADALAGGYAVGYYESWDQYSLEAALAAAEAAQAPAIIGFGAAVTNQDWLDRGGVRRLARLARDLAEAAAVPAAVLFNEARTFDQIVAALEAGCNAVMLDTSALPYDTNVAQTQRVVAAARLHGATVEAELGHLADALDLAQHASPTDPNEAARFVDATGVAALAVSIGNVHLVREGEVPVDLDLLARIHARVPVPLVLHGGTGFPAAAVRRAIACGVAKFNIGTRLKRAYLAGLVAGLPDPLQPPDIHPYVGSRDPQDVLVAAQRRLAAEIGSLIELYGTAGRAAVGPGAIRAVGGGGGGHAGG